MEQDFGDSFTPGDFLSAPVPLSPSPSPEPVRPVGDQDGNEDEASLSESAHHSSGPDEALFDIPSPHSSPRTSHGSEDDLSALEDSFASQKRQSSPFTPLKKRSPFRNPSSVRAMQTDITPPHSPSPIYRRKLHTPSRQGTPQSVRSHHGAVRTPSKLSPGKRVKKDYPLILLHVTLLQLPRQYSSEVLDATLPPAVLANWKLLQEKITNTVVERGVLVPHPREDYDLLEERLFESLELRQPRILKCGHFRLSPEEEADVLESEIDEESEVEDADKCDDCGRRIRDGRYGDTGTGSKRWDVKIFAANGLMRAGAWAAAWREMERVDVEILPWMEESMKRELELRREEEERQQHEVEHEHRDEGVGSLDDERLREIYGQNAQDLVDGLAEEAANHPDKQALNRRQYHSAKKPQLDLSLLDLLKSSFIIAAKDRRNIAIMLLSVIVLFLALQSPHTASSKTLHPNHAEGFVPTIQLTNPVGDMTSKSEAVATDSTFSSATAVISTPSILTASDSPSPGQVSSDSQEDKEEDDPKVESEESMVAEMLED